ncbi:MAG: hypothetical protein WCE52_05680 [Candidatus Acidiferrum sp.]
MVQVFATKVWGLDFDGAPLLVFSKDGNRRSYLNRAEPDALVCLVATKGKNTKDDDKGKILGIVKCGSVLVNAESHLLKISGSKRAGRDYDDHGNFKWPYGLSLKRAWYFPDEPIAADVIGKLHFSSVSGCELLSDKAARRVLRERRTAAHLTDIELFAPPSKNSRRKSGVAKPGRGPPPAVSGYQVTRTKMTSFVYVLHFQNMDIFKVGWAFDVEARAKDINQHIPSEVLRQQWEIFLWRRYSDQFQAYDAEQRLLRGPLKKISYPRRTIQNRRKRTSADM